MVALTPRKLKNSVMRHRAKRSEGASFGYDVVVDPDTRQFEKLVGQGLSVFGTGALTTFGGALKQLDGGALFPFGSGVMTMGTGLMPFGMGFLDKLKGLARKATSVVKKAVPADLKRAAVDFGKKKAQELLPKVVAKVKEEVQKKVPDLAVRLTDPLVGKLPESLQGAVRGKIQDATEKGLSMLEAGLDTAEAAAAAKLGGEEGGRLLGGRRMIGGRRMLAPMPVPTTDDFTTMSGRQLDFMRKVGLESERMRQAGNVPKRLVLDQHSRSLLDTIIADRGFEKAKKEEMREQLSLDTRGGDARALALALPGSLSRSMPKASTKKKPAGRPKGSTLKGKGVVYL